MTDQPDRGAPPNPSCTLCGEPMQFKCPKCGSTPACVDSAEGVPRISAELEKWERSPKSAGGGCRDESEFYTTSEMISFVRWMFRARVLESKKEPER